MRFTRRKPAQPAAPRPPLGTPSPTRTPLTGRVVPPPPEPSTPSTRADHSALGQIETEAITRTGLTIPSTVITPDTAPVPLPMLDFRILVVRAAPEVKDRAWRYLGELARTERGDWNLYALGVAYPHLRAEVNKLTRNLTSDQARQVHFTLAIEFLTALHRLDLTTPRVFPRLTDTALTRTSGRKRRKPPPMYDLDALPAEHV